MASLPLQMRAEIIKLRNRINTTFMYVTHDQTEAMTLGDRIVIMKDGYVNQIGTPQDLFDRPVNLFFFLRFCLNQTSTLDKTAGRRTEISKRSEVRMKYGRNLFGIPADTVKSLTLK